MVPPFRIKKKTSLFVRTVALLLVTFLVTVAVCISYMTHQVVREKNESLSRMTRSRLTQTRNDMDAVIEVLSTSTAGNLWNSDIIQVLLALDAEDPARNMRIVRLLGNSVTENLLIEDAILYSPLMEYVYHSSGKWLPLEEYEEAELIRSYEREKESRPDRQTSSGGRFCRREGELYLYFELETPIHVGTLFYRLNSAELSRMIVETNPDMTVLDAEGQLLWSSEAAQTVSPERTIRIEAVGAGETEGPGDCYAVFSEQTGWTYLCPVPFGSLRDYLSQILLTLTPFVVLYAVFCIAMSFSISRKLYRPIHTLLQVAERDPSSATRREEAADEASFLKSSYENALGQNSRYQNILEDISQDVVDQLLYKLIRGREVPEKRLTSTLQAVNRGAVLQSRLYVQAGLLQMEREDSDPIDWVVLRRSILGMMNRCRPESAEDLFLYMMGEDQLAAVYLFSREVPISHIRQDVEELAEAVQGELAGTGTAVIFGEGHVCEDVKGLWGAWQTAQEKLQRKHYEKLSAPSAEGEAEEQARREMIWVGEEIRECLKQAADGRREEGETRMQLTLDRFFHGGVEKFRGAERKLPDIIVENMLHFGMDAAEVAHLLEKWKLYEAVSEIEGQETVSTLRGFLQEAMEMVRATGRKNRYRYVEEAVDYIAAHYSDSNLSLEMVSDNIGITATYLSTLFREIRKEKFNAYLNQYRAEQAMILLRSTSMSNVEIGFQCGFNSNQTFYRVFKKVAGVTPSRYREQEEHNGGKKR